MIPFPEGAVAGLGPLERVREGLESRARRISGRVGGDLAEFVGRPGKMLRARFCLHLAEGLGVPMEKAEAAARAMELVHNASLLHDDVVDDAELRRGQSTPNKVFGTTVGLLLGDLGFTQALEEALEISPAALERLVAAVREMTIGELQEEFLKGSCDVSLEAYLGVVSRKTGALFEWCGRTLSDLSPHEHAAADPPRLAMAAGILLQLVDDIQDFSIHSSVWGKDSAKDLALRRMTLPAVLAVRDPQLRPEYLAAWNDRGPDSSARLKELLTRSGMLDEARKRCEETVRSMLCLAARLPVGDGARNLAAFVEALAAREF